MLSYSRWNFLRECEKVKTEVTIPQENRIAKVYKKVISIIVSFYISSKNDILDLFNKIYTEKELINVY